MPLSWNEIKTRATEFAKEWQGTTNEDAEAKSFLEAFFNVFGITRKKVASFEHKVKKLDKHDGYIDMFWKGNLLVEMKSANKDLDKAYTQAKEYLQTLKQEELPQYILLCDFNTFRLIDIVENVEIKFQLKDLVKNVQHFGFIAGYQQHIYKEQDPVNIKAAELMGRLHDKLKDVGYEGHSLELYLVRLLFCLFADDTAIFEKDIFSDYIEERTSEDGSDLAAKISEIFFVLNTPAEKRYKTLDEQLQAFPYVNGKLFEENLPPASFDSKMRQTLLDCCFLNWGDISPAIFGSMFQSVMNPVERRNLGAHYTSEKNILKLIKPLFLDELWAEFSKARGNRAKANEFHKKLASLKFLDPACGCGNFLVITYRELRLLEIEILKELHKGYKDGVSVLNIADMILLDVDMMYGIEIKEFPAQIAQVAMWLVDHQMNQKIGMEFGQYFARLPLRKYAKIVNGNALKIDWVSLVPKHELSFILGNPPFLGTAYQSDEQKIDVAKIFGELKSFGMLDFVSAWYAKAAEYIRGTKIKVAFVSTNSIVQGEQVGILWNYLFTKYGIKIHFAHQTFKWGNEAKGNAAVHVVVIGFANYDTALKTIYEYNHIKGEANEIAAKNINQYLIDAKEVIISPRTKPISNVPKIGVGSALLDGGYFILSKEERKEILKSEPNLAPFIKKFWSAEEFINNGNKYCFWLKNAAPEIIKNSPNIKYRLSNIKDFRNKSNRGKTKEMAQFPNLFGEERQPESNFLLIPKVSSENRKYIPIGFMKPSDIITDKVFAFPKATLFQFGILTSYMHMVWMKYTCGRLKSDYSYSNTIVYNNFPFPLNVTDKQNKLIEAASQKVLDTRKEFLGSSFADLYSDFSMPASLRKAHQALDKAVDLAYRAQPFVSDSNRMEFLFELYEKYTGELFTNAEKPKKKKRTTKE